MKALIFAAGRGERMLPLTRDTPKPLLEVGGKALIEWHLERLAAAGIRDVVINTAHLAEQFPEKLGDGSRFGLAIRYSHEGDVPLETGGGMLHALPLLGEDPFLAINGDIYCDFAFAELPRQPDGLAHLVLVNNPAHHAGGDFWLELDGTLRRSLDDAASSQAQRGTFAGIGVYRPQLLADWRDHLKSESALHELPQFALAPLLFQAAAAGELHGQFHHGGWTDVGTPTRLAELDSVIGDW